MNVIEVKDYKDTRSGFGLGLLEAAQLNNNIIGLCADLTGSLKMDSFQKQFPQRFIQTGIAEANMIGVAAGLAISGKIPFAGTFANFATSRVYDQIRQSVAYSNLNVKICASHAGLTLGEDGATHQVLEDLGMMKMLPNMTVICTADFNQTKQATLAIANYKGPVYLRFGRPVMPVFLPDKPFVIGKADVMTNGKDITLVANGHLVWEALIATKELEKEGVSVELINVATIKPLDVETIVSSVIKTGRIVTAEEHQIAGGLGESIASFLSRNHPTPMEIVGVNDTFGESGTPDELMIKYGLKSVDIIKAIKKVLAKPKIK